MVLSHMSETQNEGAALFRRASFPRAHTQPVP